MTEDFECDYADWLEDVAVRVDELGADPVVFGRFRGMLGTWKVEHEARRSKSLCDKHGYVLYNEVKILPIRNITLANLRKHHETSAKTGTPRHALGHAQVNSERSGHKESQP